MQMSELEWIGVPALTWAKRVRNGEVTSQELVEAAFNEIDRQNPQLNAVITTRKEKALQEAAAQVDTGQPFLGVPLLLKGLGQQLQGEPSTSGSRLLQDNVATQTSFFVKALQRAGFIIIGQTNFPEFGFKNITDAEIYGPARNPWNLSYQPGGSSGGAGASVAAGLVPIAAGSDGGGSIRIPSSWSGTIGLKPTRGRVPVGPSDWRSWQGAAIDFALTRSIKDTAVLLDSLQTIQPAAVFQTPLEKAGYLAQLDQPMKPVKVGYTTESPVGTPVSSDAIQAVEQAAKFLSDQGFDVEEVHVPIDGVALMASYYTMNAGETAAFMSELADGIGRPLKRTDMELLTWTLYQTGQHTSAADYSLALSKWDQAAWAMAKLHANYPIILTPTTAWPAPKVGDTLVSAENEMKMASIESLSPRAQKQLIYDQWLPALTRSPFTQQANLTGEPAISLPTAVTKEGLPLGIQFNAAKGQELALLRLGALFEGAGKLEWLHATKLE
ncbi:amidase [Levilactobacillus koreensis JCM 16448]|uniref:Amidase n=2 Tax=Levilactobacillus koreensis TaxID=637971 RepID=A0AAC8UXK8_9LACO|nr:amidase [Levilactobacillus koreensis]KRK87413.1 amidase [Levilactobacillus koreensis JCM 16448]